MPEICRFYGILIKMFYQEHNTPHFHAEYGEYKAEIKIEDFGINRGFFTAKSYDTRLGMGNETQGRTH